MGRTLNSLNIQPRIRKAIIHIKESHPDFNPRMARDFLLENLDSFRIQRYQVPKVGSFRRIMKPLVHPGTDKDKRALESIEKGSRPWHLGLMNEFRSDITPEAVSVILAVQRMIDERSGSHATRPELDGRRATAASRRRTSALTPSARTGKGMVVLLGPGASKNYLTVREAIWIARLYKAVKGVEKERIGRLHRIALAYSYAEELSILSGEAEFDSVEVDRALRDGKLPESAIGDSAGANFNFDSLLRLST